jgi:hypothetical protein
MAKGLHRIQSIHDPTLRGEPVLLLPMGLLVRWPERMATPRVGHWYAGTAVSVPANLHDAVLRFLFSACALDRCDAAKEIGAKRGQRQRILHRFLGRSMVQKMITSAERMTPELRAEIQACGVGISLRRVISLAYGLTCKEQVSANQKWAEVAPEERVVTRV